MFKAKNLPPIYIGMKIQIPKLFIKIKFTLQCITLHMYRKIIWILRGAKCTKTYKIFTNSFKVPTLTHSKSATLSCLSKYGHPDELPYRNVNSYFVSFKNPYTVRCCGQMLRRGGMFWPPRFDLHWNSFEKLPVLSCHFITKEHSKNLSCFQILMYHFFAMRISNITIVCRFTGKV